jgi:cyclase
VKKRLFGKQQVWSVNGTQPSGIDPLEFAQLVEDKGAGEIIVQSIENDGKMNGYDLDLTKRISENVQIPVITLGGARDLNDLKKAHKEAYATGVAAGSLFVYYGENKGVLINYPEKTEINF